MMAKDFSLAAILKVMKNEKCPNINSLLNINS